MANLNVKKRIEEGRKVRNERYDLSLQSMHELLEMSNDEVSLVGNSFTLGYAQGVRATISEIKRKRG